MKKVLGKMSAFIFGAFGIAVLALLMSLTYGALQKLFPGNFMNQMWGLVMFDIAAMCWAIAFVFQSKSTLQYAASGLGFIVGFVGTLGMVAAEVMLSGQNLAAIETGEIGKWMVYGFIIVTALHAALVYAHHAGAPEIHEQINVGVARGEIVTEAISQATKTLEAEKSNLAVTITHDIVSQVKRDLGLYPVAGTPFESRQYQQALPSPVRAQGVAHPEHILWDRGDDPAAYYEPGSEFALPCGHTAGQSWSKEKKSWVCNICDEPYDLQADTPAKTIPTIDRPPHYHPVHLEPKAEEPGDKPSPFPESNPE